MSHNWRKFQASLRNIREKHEDEQGRESNDRVIDPWPQDEPEPHQWPEELTLEPEWDWQQLEVFE